MSWLLLFLLMQDPPGILFPADVEAVPQIVVPVQPAPAAINTLAADEVMVLVSAQPALVLGSPDGVLNIEHTQGPVKVYAKFHGKSQAVWRLYDDPEYPHVYLITAAKPGTVELIAAESLDASAVVRRVLTVSGGGPQPPPTPTPTPTPVPTPTPTPTPPPTPKPIPGDLRVMLLLDETDSPSAAVAVRSLAVRSWLDQNCVQVGGRAEWRVYDRSTVDTSGELDDEAEVWRRLYATVKAELPDGPVCVLASGTDVDIQPFKNTYDLLDVLKGGKP